MTRSISMAVALVCGAIALFSCGSTRTESRPVPTYHQDVAPILAQRCTTCHTANGIAPFPLTTYAEVQPFTRLIRDSVISRHMPPLPPDPDDCQPIDDFRAITPAERDTLLAWIAADIPVGDPTHAAPTPPPAVEALGPATDVFDSGLDYVSTFEGNDEYRCFVMDPKFTETTYGYAFTLTSSNPRVVHHVDLRYVLPEELDKLAALEAKDAAPGYECFGGFGVDAQSLAGGGVGRAPPDGTGYKLPAGTKFVAQVHYNFTNGRDANRIAVEMWRSSTPILRTPDAFALDNEAIVIPAGAPDTSVSSRAPVVARDSSAPGIPAGMVWELTPHMHQLGSAIRLDVVHQDGSRTCLINVPRWVMHWQGTFRLARPVAITAGDQIELNCHWDNSPAHQPLVDDRPRPPREVRYGPGTDDEMCFAGGIVTAPH
jgi:hypothetical protein